MTPSSGGPAPGSGDGRQWLAEMPAVLQRQRTLLERLLELCENTPEVSSLSVGCSLGRGAGDALSDVDAAIGVDAPTGESGADRVLRAEAAVLEVELDGEAPVGVLRDRVGSPDRFVRRVFVQLADGVQLDLAIMAEAEVRRGDSAPDFVSLYRSRAPRHGGGDDGGFRTSSRSALAATGDQVHDWAFLGWVALADLAKYLERGSLWEAYQRLNDVRDRIWSLWAAARGATYPWHGLSQVLDHDPADLPPRIDATVAGLEHDDISRAAREAVELLGLVSTLAADRVGASLPTRLADHVASRHAVLFGRTQR